MLKLIKMLFDTRSAQQVKFDKARESKLKRELLEVDGKRDAVDHPIY